MANNSEAYNKINNVWKGYDKENPRPEIEVICYN